MIIDYNPEGYYYLDLDFPAEFVADGNKYSSAQDYINRTNTSSFDFCKTVEENYKELKDTILQALLYKYTQNPELRRKLTAEDLTSLTMPNGANICDRCTLEQTIVVQQFMIDKEVREFKANSSWTFDEHVDLLKECYN